MMDFVEAMKISNEICKCYFKNGHTNPCTGCPFYWNKEYMEKVECSVYLREYSEDAEKILQKWKDEHPIETNLQHYERVIIPRIKSELNMKSMDAKVMYTCNNSNIIPTLFCNEFLNCKDCRAWWNSPYKEREEK